MHRKLRVSAISFLNTAPLLWDFFHAPQDSMLAGRYGVHCTLPNICAEELASGTADIGLVPVAALAANPELVVVPGIAIASLRCVRSILLLTRKGLALRDVQSVALDATSRTSAALVKVLFCKFIGTEPAYTQHPPQASAMLTRADAALLIGDPALLALAGGARDQYECYDLAEMWNQFTRLPFVFAVWAMRRDALEGTGVTLEQVTDDFRKSRDAGLANLETLLAEWTPRIAIPPAVIYEYWMQNIHYALDNECLQGLNLFFKYAAECGALPSHFI